MKNYIALLAVALLAGCAHSHVYVQKPFPITSSATFTHTLKKNADMPDIASLTLESHLENQLRALSSNAPDAKGYTVQVTINQYRMRNTALRVFTGTFSGRDHITSMVTVTDKTSGEVVAEYQVVSRFASKKSSDNLLELHARMITNYLKTGKS